MVGLKTLTVTEDHEIRPKDENIKRKKGLASKSPTQKLIGEPIYQFKVTNVSLKGAGLLVIEDSEFLNLIEVGQIFDADFLSPTGEMPSGWYKVEIKHITKPAAGKHRGHRLVGVSIVEKIGHGNEHQRPR